MHKRHCQGCPHLRKTVFPDDTGDRGGAALYTCGYGANQIKRGGPIPLRVHDGRTIPCSECDLQMSMWEMARIDVNDLIVGWFRSIHKYIWVQSEHKRQDRYGKSHQ